MKTEKLVIPDGVAELVKRIQESEDEMKRIAGEMSKLRFLQLLTRLMLADASDAMNAAFKAANLKAFEGIGPEDHAIALAKNFDEAHLIICEVGESVESPEFQHAYESLVKGSTKESIEVHACPKPLPGEEPTVH